MPERLDDIRRLCDAPTQSVLTAAAQEAARLSHFWLGVEHLFLALIEQPNGLASKILTTAGTELRAAREAIRRMAGGGDRSRNVAPNDLCVTPRLGAIVKQALDAVQPRSVISADDLLFAILREGESVPMRALAKMGATPTRLLELAQRPEQLAQASTSATPNLDKFSRDLTRLAKEGKLRPAIGRKEELRQIARILTQREANNPLLLGEAGVGKTAIVEGFAHRLAHEQVILALQGKRVVELFVSSLMAGTEYRGQLEERLEKIVREVRNAPELILFIDEIHTMMRGGIGDFLKPALARGEFPCIGSTTLVEFQQHIERDAALSRRFERIEVAEPDAERCKEILRGILPALQAHHGVKIAESAADAAVDLSLRYLPQEHLPSKAVKLIEKACATVAVASLSPDAHDAAHSALMVTEEVVRRVLSEKTGIPLARVTRDELQRLSDMETTLNARVMGQERALEAVAQCVKRARAGLNDPSRPVGVFLFLGPTGVGKTELAKALADFLFGSDDHLIRLDMSEYMQKHEVARLIGSPPGYVGHDEEGQLTGKLRQKPYAVVLLDEIEKAHPDVHAIFLQVFDAGRLTDGKGRTIDARHALFLMTSNVGAREYQAQSIGFSKKEAVSNAQMERIDTALKSAFSPEFLNRLDRVIHFAPLTPEVMRRIVARQIDVVAGRLRAQQIALSAAPAALEFLCQQGFDPLDGARQLHRAIERLLIQPLTDLMIAGGIVAGDRVVADAGENGLVIRKEAA